MDLSEFIAALTLAVAVYYFEDVDPARKPLDTPQSAVRETYDFIVIGAGSAGCVIANRLTEVPHWNVLLIEAGGDEDAVTDTPALARQLQGTTVDWNYTTVEQEHVCRSNDGICSYPRGHVMGGSSTINLMLFVRGNKLDFDEWEQQANPGWSYSSVLTYFQKLEKLNIPIRVLNQTKDDLSVRGFFGPVTVEHSRYDYKVSEAVLSAAIESGLVQGDYNGVDQERVGPTQSTVSGPSRKSASRAYLNPIRQRKNLSILKSTLVTKIIFKDSSTVQGVEYDRDGQTYSVGASKEVILSAGAINTPKIMLLSGIGPSEDINPLDIATVRDLPVGKNLQDHPIVNIYVTTNHSAQVTVDSFYQKETILDYAIRRQGPLTCAISQIAAFKSYLNSSAPNGHWVATGEPSPNNQTDVITFAVSIIKPKSRGTVKLSSPEPADPPLINPAYLTDASDMALMKEVIRDVIDLINEPALQMIRARITGNENPLCADAIASGDRDTFIDCLVANQTHPYYHAVGTARMGPSTDTNSVVNANLTVHGVNNLRVIDASIMPNITRGNTNAPTLMIAEKGADLIKKKYGVQLKRSEPFQWTVFFLEELVLRDKLNSRRLVSPISLNYLQ